MAKDISANVKLDGGMIDIAPSLDDLELGANAGIRGLIPVGRGKAAQSDWAEEDPESDAYILNKPTIPSLDGYATENWVEGKGYLTQHQSLTNYATKSWVEGKGYLTQHQDISSKADKSEIPTKVSDLTNDSDFISGLTELVYGTSTWAEFTAAYNAKKIVYCRCPMSGNSYRYAFLAYVSNATAEFQYYRSVNTHTASQMGDQVFVYTLSSNGTWTTTTREASPKIIAGTGLESSYTKDKLTLSIKSDYPTKTEVNTMISEALAAYENGNTASY